MTAATRGLRHIAGRAVGWVFETLGGPPPGLGAADDAAGTPVVVVLLLGADAATTASTASDLAAAAPGAGARALLVMDQPHFAAARRAGVACDHVLSREAWAARGHVTAWEDYLKGEIARLRRDFVTESVVSLPVDGSAGLDAAAVRTLLRPVGGHAAPRGLRVALARLESRIDRPAQPSR